MSTSEARGDFTAAATRMESFLSDRTPRLAASSAAVIEALAAAASRFGMALPPGQRIDEGETALAAVERIAAASSLLVHPVALNSVAGDTAAAILAFRKSDDEPVLLSRRGRHWFEASRQSGWAFRSTRTLVVGDFAANGLTILPAFPDRSVSVLQLLGFGLQRHAVDLAAFVATTLLAGVIVALLPLLSEPLVEIIVPEHDIGLLGQIALFLVVVMATNLATRFAAGLARLRFEGRSGLLVRAASIDRALRIAEHAAESGRPVTSAPIAALSARSMESWYRGVWALALTAATSLLLATPNLVVMASASARAAAIVALVFVTCLGAAGIIARLRIAALMNGLNTPQSWMTTAYEGLAMIDTVRAHAAEGRLYARWTDGFLALRHRFLRSDRIASGGVALEAGLEGVLILSAVGALMLTGSISAAAPAIAFVIAAGNVAGAGSALLSTLGNVTMLALQYRLIQPILEGEPRPRPMASSVPAVTGQVELVHVSCRLSPNGPLVLDDVSLTVAPGEHIGIAGASGAGKTTLLKVLLGLVRPQSGHVLIDGCDLAGHDAAALRRQIGVVGQSGRLLPGTLFDNIAAGLPLSAEQVMAAARLAGLEADIVALPLGLATPIGGGDGGFSGGQVQRILLARAFAIRPRLIVLDEATSALDPALQSHVAAALAAINATVISVAHRLDTLKSCHRIYMIEDGRIVEAGGYAELFARGGLFARQCLAEIAAGAPAARGEQMASA